MNATNFILSRLEMIVKAVPSAGVRYAYDSHTDFHIVEVYPECVRRGDDGYVGMECDLWKDFHDRYPNADILISELDDTNDMSNLIYEHIPSSVIKESYVLDVSVTDNFVVTGNIGAAECDVYNFSFYNEAA